MKILIVNSFYFPDILGGAEVSVKKLAENMALNGHEVHVLCTDVINKTEVINNVMVHRIKVNNIYNPIEASEKSGIQKILYRLIDYINWFNYLKVKKCIKGINPQIIHSNNLYGISAIIWIIGHKLGIPLIHTVRDYNLINIMNGSHFTKNNKHLKIINKLHKKIQKLLLKKVNYITGPSKAVLKQHREVLLKNNNTVIYNSIDFEKEKLFEIQRIKKKQKNKHLNYCFVGTLDIHKGVMDLITAFNMTDFKDDTLHIAGKGVLEKQIIESVKENSNIIFHGFLKEEELSRLLLKSDCLVVPSKWEEPFGRVVLDAYKHVIPVVVSDKGGLPEIVDHGVTGIVINPEVNNIKLSLTQIRELISSEDITDNIINKLQDFSLDRQITDFEKLYKKVVKKNEDTN